MTELLPAWPMLSAFLLAGFVLAATPGPGVLYIVARCLAQGRRFGLASVVGVALGNLGNALGASIGLAALFAVSSMAFTVVKFAGAAYLCFLGVQALRSAPAAAPPTVATRATSLVRVFADGFVVALLNPKTALFFAAFLPQFMRTDVLPLPQSMALGTLFVATAALTDTLYALAAGSVAPSLTRARAARSLGRYLSAGAFIGLGLYTALSGSGSGKPSA